MNFWFKLVSLGALALLLVAMVVGGTSRGQDFLIRRAIEEQLTSTRSDLFEEDALRVLVCGSSSPLPAKNRAKPCVAVIAAGKMWIVDTGPGSWFNMAYWRIPGERIGAVLLTHYHSDHIGDLGEFNMQTWVAGRPGPLAVYGGPGIERVVAGFTEAYALDTGYRVAHHGSELIPVERSVMVPHTIDAKPAGEAVTVIEDGGLRITAFAVDHAPVEPALAYRFDWKGRSVIVSGDTVATESMVRHARGIDVLAHEAQAQHMVAMLREGAAAHGRPRVEKIMSDIPDYHTSPVEVVEMAAKAGVRLALLYHLTPPPRNLLMERILLRGVSSVPHKGVEVEVADDGTLVTLPADSEEFEVSKIK